MPDILIIVAFRASEQRIRNEVDMKTVEITRTSSGVALAGIALSLLMSGWALAASLDDDDERYRQATEQRLTCLELPGPNDCGADGR